MAQSGLACLTGGQVVGGSNPLAPTIFSMTYDIPDLG